MIERTQPICKGIDAKGELIWGIIPMPRWQMEMLRVRYYGDFMAFWIKRQFYDMTGFEMTHDSGSMELHDWTEDLKRKYKKLRSEHSGD